MSTEDELKAELEKLKKENESLKARTSKGVSLKVSEKGGVSVVTCTSCSGPGASWVSLGSRCSGGDRLEACWVMGWRPAAPGSAQPGAASSRSVRNMGFIGVPFRGRSGAKHARADCMRKA